MNFAELGPEVLKYVIATVPGLGLIAGNMLTNFKKIKTNTQAIQPALEDAKASLQGDYAKSEATIAASLTKYNTDIHNTLLDVKDEINEKVNGNLEGMKTELSTYQRELTETKDQVNVLAKQNKLYMDTIAAFVGQNPEFIKSGVASAISSKVALTKEELANYPELLVKDIHVLENALTEAKSVLGEEAYQELIDKVNAKEV